MLQTFHCEHVLEELGDLGRYQKTLITGVLVPLAIVAAIQSSTLHNEMVPDHWCHVPVLANFSYGEQHRLIRPRLKTDLDLHQKYQLSQCEMYDIDYQQAIVGLDVMAAIRSNSNESSIPIGTVVPTKPCSNGWMFDRIEHRDSAAMHYGFVCQHKNGIETMKIVRKLSSATFTCVYAFVGDRFGRRIGLILILFAYVLSAISPIGFDNYSAFLVCQALNASTYPMNILIVIVLGIEFVTIQHRSDVVLFIWLAFHFGEWIAFLFAQLLSHWIWITAVNSLIVLPCLAFVVFGTDETPQWILSQGMKYSTRLKAIFEKVNQTNRAKMDRHSINSIVSKFTHFGETYKQKGHKNENSRKSTPNDLNDTNSLEGESDDDDRRSELCLARVRLFLRRSTLFQMILLFAFLLITNELVIDFMQRERAKFVDNEAIDKFLGSLIKMPAIVLTWYMIEQRIGRRWSNCVMLTLNLAVLIGTIMARLWFRTLSWLHVTGSMMAIMLAECSIIITLLQTIELSPTRFRLIVLGLTYSIGKFSSTGLTYAFNLYSLRILFNVYMRIIILLTMTLLSILIATFIAETRNEFLPLGLLASEQLITSVRYWSMSKKKSDITPSNLFLSMSKWDINSNHQIVGSIKHMEKFTDS
ncbi:Sugar transporter [Blomia tropicalis]|nr:Sugar transporter [Blomia tropicalis]